MFIISKFALLSNDEMSFGSSQLEIFVWGVQNEIVDSDFAKRQRCRLPRVLVEANIIEFERIFFSEQSKKFNYFS